MGKCGIFWAAKVALHIVFSFRIFSRGAILRAKHGTKVTLVFKFPHLCPYSGIDFHEVAWHNNYTIETG
jgi:hypothetical protein